MIFRDTSIFNLRVLQSHPSGRRTFDLPHLISLLFLYLINDRFPIVQPRDAAANADQQTFPAMSKAEIEDWLAHVPVFAVTDSQGSGVVLKPDNDTSVFYFFMSPMQANATLQQLKGANSEMDLKVSAFSLGKIWFNLLQSGPEKEVTVSIYWVNI